MKKMFLVFLVLSAVSYAQTDNAGLVFSGGGGFSIPTNKTNFRNSFSTGFNLQTNIGYTLNEYIQPRLDIQYGYFRGKTNASLTFPQIGSEDKLTIVSLKADVLIGNCRKCWKFRWYGLAGFGMYYLNETVVVSGVKMSDGEYDFGVGFGGGLFFQIHQHAGIYVETQYNYILNDGAANGYIPVRIGVQYMK